MGWVSAYPGAGAPAIRVQRGVHPPGCPSTRRWHEHPAAQAHQCPAGPMASRQLSTWAPAFCPGSGARSAQDSEGEVAAGLRGLGITKEVQKQTLNGAVVLLGGREDWEARPPAASPHSLLGDSLLVFAGGKWAQRPAQGSGVLRGTGTELGPSSRPRPTFPRASTPSQGHRLLD